MKKNEELRHKELERMNIGSIESADPQLKKKNQQLNQYQKLIFKQQKQRKQIL
jgi:hypothetical protein